MKVVHLEGHTTVFLVRGESLHCKTPGCHKVEPGATTRADAKICAKCGGVLEPRWHQVDTAAYGAVGHCGCERFQFHHKKRLDRMPTPVLTALTPDQRPTHRCKHIMAARDLQLDECLLALPPEQSEDGP